MSLKGIRLLYKDIPRAERRCNYYGCQQAILANIDQDKGGRIYHHGCLITAETETFRCLECYATFDGTEVAFEFQEHFKGDEVTQRSVLSCPHCGCRALKRLNREASS